MPIRGNTTVVSRLVHPPGTVTDYLGYPTAIATSSCPAKAKYRVSQRLLIPASTLAIEVTTSISAHSEALFQQPSLQVSPGYYFTATGWSAPTRYPVDKTAVSIRFRRGGVLPRPK